MSIPMSSIALLIDHGRMSSVLSLSIGLVCVLGIIFSVPLHIESMTSQLSTIADIAVPSGVVGSAAHTYFQSRKSIP